MNVTVEILGRATMDAPFTQLVAPAVLTVVGSSVGFTPALPPGSDGLELRLRVQSSEALNVDVGGGLDPANPPQPTPIFTNGIQTGTTPALPSAKRATFAAWGGQPRDIPFGSRESFLIRLNGAPS